MSGRYNTGDELDLLRQIADLRKRVADLESGNRVGVTSIDKGALRVKSGSLEIGTMPQVFFGTGSFSGGVSQGWVFRRDTGASVFDLGGTPGDQFWALRDEQGNVLFGDDTASGQGIASPYIPIPFVPASSTVPADTTTSGSFATLQTSLYIKQHPKVIVEVLCRASDGTTSGEVQLIKATGEVLGLFTVTLGAFAFTVFGPVAVPGAHLAQMELQIQGRRTAGAGTIGARVLGCWALQS
jgi:hypothetical protein